MATHNQMTFSSLLLNHYKEPVHFLPSSEKILLTNMNWSKGISFHITLSSFAIKAMTVDASNQAPLSSRLGLLHWMTTNITWRHHQWRFAILQECSFQPCSLVVLTYTKQLNPKVGTSFFTNILVWEHPPSGYNLKEHSTAHQLQTLFAHSWVYHCLNIFLGAFHTRCVHILTRFIWQKLVHTIVTMGNTGTWDSQCSKCT